MAGGDVGAASGLLVVGAVVIVDVMSVEVTECRRRRKRRDGDIWEGEVEVLGRVIDGGTRRDACIRSREGRIGQ